jgi:hypothetical protein
MAKNVPRAGAESLAHEPAFRSGDIDSSLSPHQTRTTPFFKIRFAYTAVSPVAMIANAFFARS